MATAKKDDLLARLIAAPYDHETLKSVHAQLADVPESYAALLETAAERVDDAVAASYWFTEAALVWASTPEGSERALSLLRAATASDPLNGRAAEQLTHLFRETGRHDELAATQSARAEALAELAVDDEGLAPHAAEVFYSLAVLFADLMGENGPALIALERSLGLDVSRDAAGLARELSQRSGDAKNALRFAHIELTQTADPVERSELEHLIAELEQERDAGVRAEADRVTEAAPPIVGLTPAVYEDGVGDRTEPGFTLPAELAVGEDDELAGWGRPAQQTLLGGFDEPTHVDPAPGVRDVGSPAAWPLAALPDPVRRPVHDTLREDEPAPSDPRALRLEDEIDEAWARGEFDGEGAPEAFATAVIADSGAAVFRDDGGSEDESEVDRRTDVDLPVPSSTREVAEALADEVIRETRQVVVRCLRERAGEGGDDPVRRAAQRAVAAALTTNSGGLASDGTTAERVMAALGLSEAESVAEAINWLATIAARAVEQQIDHAVDTVLSEVRDRTASASELPDPPVSTKSRLLPPPMPPAAIASALAPAGVPRLVALPPPPSARETSTLPPPPTSVVDLSDAALLEDDSPLATVTPLPVREARLPSTLDAGHVQRAGSEPSVPRSRLPSRLPEDELVDDEGDLAPPSAILGTVSRLGRLGDAQAACELVADVALGESGARLCIVHRFDEAHGEFVVVAAAGDRADALEQMLTPANDPMLRDAVDAGEAIVVRAGGADRRLERGRWALARPRHAVLCAPVSRDGTVVGAVELVDLSDGREFTIGDIELMTEVASRVAELVEGLGRGERASASHPG